MGSVFESDIKPVFNDPTIRGVDNFLQEISAENHDQPEFIQAVEELIRSIYPILKNNPEYIKHNIPGRIVRPDHVYMFRVDWSDQSGQPQTNIGYRVQFNGALGPYKGGLRFHPSVNLSRIKFLGFEQVFKNALTGQSLGGGKGGSNFNPKGKTDYEIMTFCQKFMEKLAEYIGADRDVPAGDIGVGLREIGYLFGQYRRCQNKFESGTITGKGPEWGGSFLRPEATGYGTVIFAEAMLKEINESFSGKTVAISGSGNVSQYAAEKALHLHAKVVTMSDSNGVIYDKEGITREKLDFIMELKNKRYGRIKEYAEKYGVDYFETTSDKKETPWQRAVCDIALPCATENELDLKDAEVLVANGTLVVAEGANMPSTPEAVDFLYNNNVLFGPAKAVNAGGVAVSGLEMSQNGQKMRWTKSRVSVELDKIMHNIHKQCLDHGREGDRVNYVTGANRAGFKRVADAMVAMGW